MQAKAIIQVEGYFGAAVINSIFMENRLTVCLMNDTEHCMNFKFVSVISNFIDWFGQNNQSSKYIFNAHLSVNKNSCSKYNSIININLCK